MQTSKFSGPSKLRRLLNAAGAVFLGLVLLELSLRGLGLFASIDARQSRERNLSEYRILCLGDSWTHGLGSVSYGEALETRLNAADGAGRGYRVVRSGIPGSNSSQGLHRLARLLSEDRYDMLIVLLGNNDHQNLAESDPWRFHDEPSRIRRWGAGARVLTHYSRVYKLYRTLRLRLSGRPTPDQFFFGEGPGRAEATRKAVAVAPGPHRRQLEHNLTQIVDLARLLDVEPVFMTYFYFHGYEVNESILRVATTYGVPVVNNTVSFHERIPPAQRGDYFYGAHPTTKGHAFIARNIMETVEFE